MEGPQRITPAQGKTDLGSKPNWRNVARQGKTASLKGTPEHHQQALKSTAVFPNSKTARPAAPRFHDAPRSMTTSDPPIGSQIRPPPPAATRAGSSRDDGDGLAGSDGRHPEKEPPERRSRASPGSRRRRNPDKQPHGRHRRQGRGRSARPACRIPSTM